MKKTTILALLLAAVMLFGACGTLTEIDKIDTEVAKAIALKALSLTGEEVSYAEAVLHERDGRKYYDVKITVDGIDYMFAVDATSGVIIEQSENVALLMKEEVEPAQNEDVEPVEVIPPPIVSESFIQLTPAEVEYPKHEIPKSESTTVTFQASTLLKLIQEHSGYERMEIKVIAKFIGASYGELPFHVYFVTPEGKYYHYIISRRTSTILSWESADDLNGLSHPLRNSTAEVILPSDVIPIEEAYGYALRMGIYYDMKTDTLCEPWADDVLLYVAEPDYNNGEYEYDFIFQEKKTGNFYHISVKADNGAICQFTCGTWSKGYFGAPTDIKSIKMSEYEAKKAVLSCVPAAEESDITAFTTNTEDGKMEYVGTLTYGGMYYAFTIDAYSGAFRSWEATPAK